MALQRKTRMQVITFGIIAAGAAVFLAVVVFPFTAVVREHVTVDGTVISSAEGTCVVSTPDGDKIVSNCDLPQGSTVTVQYEVGMPDAWIVTRS